MASCMRVKSLQSCLTLCDPMNCSPPGTSVHGFSREEYWSGLLCPPPRDLPDPGIGSESLMSPALAGGFFLPLAPPGKLMKNGINVKKTSKRVLELAKTLQHTPSFYV